MQLYRAVRVSIFKAFTIFKFVASVAMGFSVPAFASSTAKLKPHTPPQVLSQTEEAGFVRCGFDCEYSQANTSYSQKLLYLEKKRDGIQSIMKEYKRWDEVNDKGALDSEEANKENNLKASLKQELRGTCVSGEEENYSGYKNCFERFKAITASEIRKIRATMVSHSDTVRSLRSEGGDLQIEPSLKEKSLKVQAPEVRSIEKMQADYKAESEYLNETLTEDYKNFVNGIAFEPMKSDYMLWKSDPGLKPEDVEFRLEIARDCSDAKTLTKQTKCTCEAGADGASFCYDSAAFAKAYASYQIKKDTFVLDKKRLIETATSTPLELPLILREDKARGTNTSSWAALKSSRGSVVEAVNNLIDKKPWKMKDAITAGEVDSGLGRKPTNTNEREFVKTDSLPTAWTVDGARRSNYHVRMSQEDVDAVMIDADMKLDLQDP